MIFRFCLPTRLCGVRRRENISWLVVVDESPSPRHDAVSSFLYRSKRVLSGLAIITENRVVKEQLATFVSQTDGVYLNFLWITATMVFRRRTPGDRALRIRGCQHVARQSSGSVDNPGTTTSHGEAFFNLYRSLRMCLGRRSLCEDLDVETIFWVKNGKSIGSDSGTFWCNVIFSHYSPSARV